MEVVMEAAEKFSITLPAEMARIIRAKLEGGTYGSNSEVIREAMRTWMDQERPWATLDAAIARGIADADAGRVHTLDEVREHMRLRFGEPVKPAR
jgi:antitoxin ParD1/3/4